MEKGRPTDFVPGISRTRLIVAAAALVLVYLLFVAASNAIQAHRLGEEEARLRQQLRETQYEYQQLEALRDYMQSDEYVEAVARRELGMGYPGETNVVVRSPAPEDGQSSGGGRKHWWDVFFR